TEAAFAATIAKTINDVIAGAKIVLQPTTRAKTSASYNGSHIFIETSYGKYFLPYPYQKLLKPLILILVFLSHFCQLYLQLSNIQVLLLTLNLI
ncbi:hypothetical protein IscW_ISCW016057, partial [Ixodes scapularis]